MWLVCDADSPSANRWSFSEWHNTCVKTKVTDVFCFQFGAICKNKLGANFTLAISKTGHQI